MNRTRTLLVAILASLAVAVVGVGCGDDEDGEGDSGSQFATAEEATTKPPEKPDRLVIRTPGSFYGQVMKDTVVAAFEEDTGIPVTLDHTDEAVTFTTSAQAIRAGERPPVDADINLQTRAYLDTVRDNTLPISPEVAPNLEVVNPVVAEPTGLELNEDGSWPYVGVYQLSVPFIQRADLVKEGEVTSWKDLADPALEDSIELDLAFQSVAFGVAEMLGVEVTEDEASLDEVWDFVETLQPNVALFGTSVDVVRGLTDGRVKVAITPPLDGVTAAKEGVPIRMVAPEEGMVVVTDAYYIHKNIPQNVYYYAHVFANYLLDPEVQAQWATELGLVPVNPEAEVPAFMAKSPDVFPRTPEELEAVNAIIAPVPEMAQNQDAWQSSYEAAVGG